MRALLFSPVAMVIAAFIIVGILFAWNNASGKASEAAAADSSSLIQVSGK